MDILSLKKVTPTLIKHGIVPYLHGTQGLGKTQVVRQIAEEMGIGFVALYPATQEVGDLVGLLEKRSDGSVYHMRPEWFPTTGSGILFIDEINRAHPDVIQAMFSLILDKTIHKHVLPPGWSIVVAGNYASNNFLTTNTKDDAWNSRFCHIDFKPTASEFVQYAESKQALSVAAFIRDNPACLEGTKQQFMDDNGIKPNRRAWLDFIAPLENEEMDKGLRMEVYSGIVGKAAAAAKISHGEQLEKSLSIHDIMRDYAKVQSRVLDYSVREKGESRFDLLNSSTDELILMLKKDGKLLTKNEAYIPNLKQFFLDMPLEMSQKVFKDMESIAFIGRDAFINDKAYVEQIINNDGKRTDGVVQLKTRWKKSK